VSNTATTKTLNNFTVNTKANSNQNYQALRITLKQFISHFSSVAEEAVEMVLHLMVNDLGLRHWYGALGAVDWNLF
jgi:hypothetical protein